MWIRRRMSPFRGSRSPNGALSATTPEHQRQAGFERSEKRRTLRALAREPDRRALLMYGGLRAEREATGPLEEADSELGEERHDG